MGARLQSDVSTGKAGKKGAALNAVGDNVGAPLPPAAMPLQGHKEFGPGQQARIAPDYTGRRKNVAPTGGPDLAVIANPLAGHAFMPNDSEGNSPSRRAGSKTPPQNPGKPSVTA
jgi:hypothetical protein